MTRRPARLFAALALPILLAACGGGATQAPAASAAATAAATARATAAPPSVVAPASSAAAGASAAAGGSTNAAATCTDLSSLRTMDYAFGAKLRNVKALEAPSMKRTLEDLAFFATTAPTELQAPTAVLIAVWTDLAADPSAVTDDRWTKAGDPFTAWMTANCK
jgi:hypothetical protein